MRDIRFRGKDANTWVYGDLTHHTIIGEDYVGISNKSDTDRNGCATRHMVKPETVGQFTGVNDPNGKEVWESDIIGYIDSETNITSVFGVVRWSEEGCFYINDNSSNGYSGGSPGANVGYMIPHHKSLIVIGNVYDNPELLK